MEDEYNFHRNSALVKGNQNSTDIIVKHQVQPMIIVDNMIHHIINLNLLIITNIKSVVMIEQHNKLPTELIMVGKSGKCGIIHSGIPSPYINNCQLFHWVMNRIIGRKTQFFLLVIPWRQKPERCTNKSHSQS